MTELPPTDLFPGFRLLDIEVDGVRLRVRTGGSGPPLLLLHGNPQTHAMWHKMAPALAQRFTLVCPDLRGYGDSAKPPSDDSHTPYSKRVMARDMVGVMEALGHPRFRLAGHDRGGRVAHRLTLDHPERVIRLAVLDIAPTREMYRGTTDAFARAYWHWFFMIQPTPLPERLMGADPDWFWLARCGAGSAGLTPFTPEALSEYLRCFRDPATIHATCEEYRASATIDIAHDDADGGRTVACPLLALWSERGAIHRCFDVLALWRQRASDVRGRPLPGGHYLPEELPETVTEEFLRFFGEE